MRQMAEADGVHPAERPNPGWGLQMSACRVSCVRRKLHRKLNYVNSVNYVNYVYKFEIINYVYVVLLNYVNVVYKLR